MPLDPTIYGDIGKPVQSVNRLAQIFDPTVIQARQLEDAQTQHKHSKAPSFATLKTRTSYVRS